MVQQVGVWTGDLSISSPHPNDYTMVPQPFPTPVYVDILADDQYQKNSFTGAKSGMFGAHEVAFYFNQILQTLFLVYKYRMD